MWTLCVFFLTAFTASAVTQKVIMDIPGSTIINGKNISVIGILGLELNINVDGVIIAAKDKETTLINGVYVYVYGFSRGPPKAILDLTVDLVCGDGYCGLDEDSVICCTDCGCLSEKFACVANRCIENITSSAAANECNTDLDCDDSNPCTVDSCDISAYPKVCNNDLITACILNDQCCPLNCDTPEDNDCSSVDKCSSDADCVDANPCTSESCVGTPKRCETKTSLGCNLNNQCVSEGTINEGSFCVAKSGVWTKQGVDGVSCDKNFECLSLECSWKTCGSGKPSLLPKIFMGVIILLGLVILTYLGVAIKKNNS